MSIPISIFIFIYFRYLISTLMLFLYFLTNILRQIKKIIVELMNRLLYNTINQFGVIVKIMGNIKSIFLFLESFFGENCVRSPSLLSSAESFSLDIPGKTTSWITSICSKIWEEADGTSSLTIQYQNVYFFWWNMFLKNSINIY